MSEVQKRTCPNCKLPERYTYTLRKTTQLVCQICGSIEEDTSGSSDLKKEQNYSDKLKNKLDEYLEFYNITFDDDNQNSFVIRDTVTVKKYGSQRIDFQQQLIKNSYYKLGFFGFNKLLSQKISLFELLMFYLKLFSICGSKTNFSNNSDKDIPDLTLKHFLHDDSLKTIKASDEDSPKDSKSNTKEYLIRFYYNFDQRRVKKNDLVSQLFSFMEQLIYSLLKDTTEKLETTLRDIVGLTKKDIFDIDEIIQFIRILKSEDLFFPIASSNNDNVQANIEKDKTTQVFKKFFKNCFSELNYVNADDNDVFYFEYYIQSDKLFNITNLISSNTINEYRNQVCYKILKEDFFSNHNYEGTIELFYNNQRFLGKELDLQIFLKNIKYLYGKLNDDDFITMPDLFNTMVLQIPLPESVKDKKIKDKKITWLNLDEYCIMNNDDAILQTSIKCDYLKSMTIKSGQFYAVDSEFKKFIKTLTTFAQIEIKKKVIEIITTYKNSTKDDAVVDASTEEDVDVDASEEDVEDVEDVDASEEEDDIDESDSEEDDDIDEGASEEDAVVNDLLFQVEEIHGIKIPTLKENLSILLKLFFLPLLPISLNLPEDDFKKSVSFLDNQDTHDMFSTTCEQLKFAIKKKYENDKKNIDEYLCKYIIKHLIYYDVKEKIKNSLDNFETHSKTEIDTFYGEKRIEQINMYYQQLKYICEKKISGHEYLTELLEILKTKLESTTTVEDISIDNFKLNDNFNFITKLKIKKSQLEPSLKVFDENKKSDIIDSCVNNMIEDKTNENRLLKIWLTTLLNLIFYKPNNSDDKMISDLTTKVKYLRNLHDALSANKDNACNALQMIFYIFFKKIPNTSVDVDKSTTLDTAETINDNKFITNVVYTRNTEKWSNDIIDKFDPKEFDDFDFDSIDHNLYSQLICDEEMFKKYVEHFFNTGNTVTETIETLLVLAKNKIEDDINIDVSDLVEYFYKLSIFEEKLEKYIKIPTIRTPQSEEKLKTSINSDVNLNFLIDKDSFKDFILMFFNDICGDTTDLELPTDVSITKSKLDVELYISEIKNMLTDYDTFIDIDELVNKLYKVQSIENITVIISNLKHILEKLLTKNNKLLLKKIKQIDFINIGENDAISYVNNLAEFLKNFESSITTEKSQKIYTDLTKLKKHHSAINQRDYNDLLMKYWLILKLETINKTDSKILDKNDIKRPLLQIYGKLQTKKSDVV